MTDELQNAVANALGMEVSEQGENTPETQPSTETQTEQVEPQVPAQEDSVVDTPDQPAQKSNSGDNSTIRGMREQLAQQKAEYKKLEETLSKISDYLGKSPEDILAEAQQKVDKQKADSLGISPEIAKTIREQEQRIRELEEASIREDFNNRANNFKKEFNLNEKQINDFFRDAVAKGFDLMRKGTDLGVIYRAINFDRLSAAKEAEIRQNILNEMQQQRESANGITNVLANSNNANASSSESDQDFVNAIRNNFK